jgi:hypothetical protein
MYSHIIFTIIYGGDRSPHIHINFSDTHVENSPLFVNAENFKVVMLFPNTVFPLIPSGHTKQCFLVQPLKVIIDFIIPL